MLHAIRIADLDPTCAIEVSPSVASLLLLMADSSLQHGSDDWRVFWRHDTDPMSRLGYNWPRESSSASRILQRLSHDLSAQELLYQSMLAIGARLLAVLTPTQRATVAGANVGKGPYEMTYRFKNSADTVICQYATLPIDYAFPYIGRAVFTWAELPTAPPRLVGIDVEI